MGLESGTFISDLVDSNPVGASDFVSQGDNHLRLLKTLIKNSFPNVDKATHLQQPRTDVASASTTNLGVVASDNVRITGTTTITSFGTVAAGVVKLISFSGALTLTQGGALSLPTEDDIVTATGDRALAFSLGSGNWNVAFYQRNTGRALDDSVDWSDLPNPDTLNEITTAALDDMLVAADEDDADELKGITIENILEALRLVPTVTELDTANDSLYVKDATNTTLPRQIAPDNVVVGEANLAPGSLLAIVEDQKASGTDGGSAVNGAWRQRDLNTEVYDRDAYVSISGNNFTLIAGTYEISWTSPCRGISEHRSRLFNVTEATVVATSRSASTADSQLTTTEAAGIARVTINDPTVFRIEYRTAQNRSGDGLGVGFTAAGSTEKYTQVVIRKG